MKIKKLMPWLLLLSLGTLSGCAHRFNNQPNVHRFIDKMTVQHGFDRHYLVTLFDNAVFRSSAVHSVKKPAESSAWYQYRQIFITKTRIAEGTIFWKEHANTLALAERKYGVPASIIVSILGVETEYGRHEGQYRVLDSLSTLAFCYSRRSSFFEYELTEFLLLTRDAHWDPTRIRGSYAGAIGEAQFMPSNYRHYAINAHHEGYSDLMTNADDAILSIANYLNAKSWHRNGPIAKQLHGHHLPDSPDIITLQNYSAIETWRIFHNFQVIMRYNPRIPYAMVVYQLSDAIKKSR